MRWIAASLVSLTALLWGSSTNAVAGCEICPPGAECVWDECTATDGGCYRCEYICPEGMVCTMSRCPDEQGGEMICSDNDT
jgi:hypothetical protein